MERSVALKKLGKLLGSKLGYRVDPKAPRPDERDAAHAALTPAVAERDALREKRDARREAILAADMEYQQLKTAAKAAGEHVDRLSSTTRRKKITVGTSEGMFFLVRAEGDTWEEIIEKLTPVKRAAS